MKENKNFLMSGIVTAALVFILMASLPAHGSGSGHKVNVDDLIGIRASSVDSTMESRGFVNRGGYNKGNVSYAIWWNASTSQCYSVATYQGRVDEVKGLPDENCARQHTTHGGGSDHKVNVDDLIDTRAGSLDSTMESRGFVNRGGYNQGNVSYTTWWNAFTNQCYSVTTYQGRVDEVKGLPDAYCDRHQHATYGGRPANKVNIDDLVGTKARNLDSIMKSRGFINKGGYKEGNSSYTTWWNASSSQCYSVATNRGKVDRVLGIADGKCR
jgi:hypothetical protein